MLDGYLFISESGGDAMLLFLVRHAKAVERAFDIPENNRFLTPDGRERFREAAQKLRKKGMETEIIVTSPLVRAVQTAEILAEGLSFRGQLPVDETLAPGFDLDGLNRLLSRHPGVNSMACVGHEPDLSELGNQLLQTPGAVILRKGAVLALEWNRDAPNEKADFLWLHSRGVFHTDPQRLKDL
jgi:phosphohistidine phosphatase